MADGSKLPQASGKALAHVIQEQAARRTMAANPEWMCEFELANNEFANLGNAVFKVQPVERVEERKGRQSKVKPYEWPPISKSPPSTVKIILPVDFKKTPSNPNCAYIEVPSKTPVILKRPDVVMAEPTLMGDMSQIP